MASSSLTDCSSSLEVSSSSLVDCSSSLTDCISSLEDFSSSLEVSSSSLVVWRYSSLARSSCFERRDARVDVRGALARAFDCIHGDGLLRPLLVRRRRFLEDDQKQVRLGGRVGACRHRPDRQIDGGEVAVGFDPQPRVAHRLSAGHGFVQGGGQLPPQPFAGHLQDVHAGLARGRFQVQAGAAVEVEDVAALVDERADRGVLLQQRPFGQLAQLELAFAGRLRGGPRGGPAFRQGREILPMAGRCAPEPSSLR